MGIENIVRAQLRAWPFRKHALMGAAVAGLLACGDDDKNAKPTESAGDPALSADAGGDAGRQETCTPVAPSGPADAPHAGDADPSMLPIVFVHGFVGSASQFDSQAQRLVANGYAPAKLHAYDHDGLLGDPMADGLDAFINDVLAKNGATQVLLLGHSRGTTVSNTYLSTPARAAKVKKVVLLDGRACNPEYAIPCDAPNQTNLPGEKHVEVATSEESFKRWYKFLFEKDPTVSAITRQSEPVKISGRAVNFPANTGRSGATLDVYELDDKGSRVGCSIATQAIPESGEWGPVTVNPDKHYELALKIETGYQHFYFQPFLRSTKFIRLLSGDSMSASRTNTNAGPGHAALTVLRMREWTSTDELLLKVTGPTPIESGNVIKESVNKLDTMGTSRPPIALYLHDDAATPKMTSLAELPYFKDQPFQHGFDVYLPAAEPTNGVITVTNHPRGDATKPQVLNFPNWSSEGHTIMVMYSDFPQ